MAEKTNNRYKDISDYIRVGYNYIKNKFYVSNKGSVTYRNTIKDIQAVLHALNIDYIEDTTIASFKATMEEVTDIYYTLSDTGAYISSLQFNDFSDYPIILDCEKSKLYIKNSTVIYDLKTKESPKIVRVPRLCSFYKEVLGLDISQSDMLELYELITSYYYPTCYVQLQPRNYKEDPLYYGDTLILSNYSESANAVYYWKYNPLNKSIPKNIANITGINANNNQIILKEPLSEETIKEYNLTENSIILVNGVNVQIGDNTYTCDGSYTISDINSNIITVSNTLPINYQYPYYTCSLISDTYNIVSIDRDTNSIEVEETPDNILIGNTICILGTTITTEYETLTCDGIYTVNNIEDNFIYVNEVIPTNYTGTGAKIYKEVYTCNIDKIENQIIYFTETPSITMTQHKVMVYNNSINTVYTVSGQQENTIAVTEQIDNYISEYPQMQYPIPSSEVRVTITYVKEQYEQELPLGEFILDTPEQARDYLLNYTFVKAPSESLIYKVYKEYEYKIEVRLRNIGYIDMKFLGLYSEIYEDEK